jgi:rhomboid protease GluP
LRNLGVKVAFSQLVIGACVTLWVVMLLLSGGNVMAGSITTALSPSQLISIVFGASGAVPVFGLHRWWTVLSAGWLHAGLLHIGFNMYWVYMMGPAIEELFGPARTIIIYTVGGVTGFLLSSCAGEYLNFSIPFLHTAGLTVGASAPVFGLIGALYHYGRIASSSIKQQATSIILQAVVFGLLMPGIDNYAHAGGFIGGYLTSAWLNPLTKERGDHMVIAIGCLVATVASIVVSILHGLVLLRTAG